MKKYISISVFVILINSITIAQNKNFDVVKPPNDFGIELGPSLSQNTHTNNNNQVFPMTYDIKMGYIGGAFFQYNINSYFSLKTSVDYEKKLIAEHIEVNLLNKDVTEQWRTFYNYITIPLLAKYNVNFKKNRFFIDAGTNIDILIQSKGKAEATSININSNYNDTKECRRFILGISAGIGATLPINKKYDMSFEVRDNYGLTQIYKYINGANNKVRINSELFLYSIIYHIKEKKK